MNNVVLGLPVDMATWEKVEVECDGERPLFNVDKVNKRLLMCKHMKMIVTTHPPPVYSWLGWD